MGLGLGLHSIWGDRADGSDVGILLKKASKFGFAPRVGVYLGRINLGATYNVIEDASYLQINFGVRILSREE